MREETVKRLEVSFRVFLLIAGLIYILFFMGCATGPSYKKWCRHAALDKAIIGSEYGQTFILRGYRRGQPHAEAYIYDPVHPDTGFKRLCYDGPNRVIPCEDLLDFQIVQWCSPVYYFYKVYQGQDKEIFFNE